MSNSQDRRSPHDDSAAYPLSRLPRLATPHSNYHIIDELPATPPPLPTAGWLRSRHSFEQVRPHGLHRSDFDFDAAPGGRDGEWSAPALLHTSDATNAPQRQELFSWSERSTAAFLGFAAGMVVVVPIVFYLSLGSNTRANTVVLEASINAPVKAGSGAPAGSGLGSGLGDRPAVKAAETIGTSPAFAAASVADGVWVDVRAGRHPTLEHDIEAATRSLMREGRLAEARVALSKAASPETARLWFVLAETYDPLIGPAEAGIRAAPQTLNTPGTHLELARHYYRLALAHGIDEATGRLGALAKADNEAGDRRDPSHGDPSSAGRGRASHANR